MIATWQEVDCEAPGSGDGVRGPEQGRPVIDRNGATGISEIDCTGDCLLRLSAEAEAINRAGAGIARFLTADLSTAEGRAAVINSAEAEAGGVDILVNNTGGPPARLAGETTADDWRSQLEAMLIPVTEITRHFLPAMRQRKWGRVITVASSGVTQPLPNLAISNGLRSAILGWSKTLSAEVARDGVTVNVLVPGRIHTDRVNQLDAIAARNSNRTVEEISDASKASIPMGRYGKTEEFAAFGVFLASVQAAYVTGTAIRIDGGMIRSV